MNISGDTKSGANQNIALGLTAFLESQPLDRRYLAAERGKADSDVALSEVTYPIYFLGMAYGPDRPVNAAGRKVLQVADEVSPPRLN